MRCWDERKRRCPKSDDRAPTQIFEQLAPAADFVAKCCSSEFRQWGVAPSVERDFVARVRDARDHRGVAGCKLSDDKKGAVRAEIVEHLDGVVDDGQGPHNFASWRVVFDIHRERDGC